MKLLIACFISLFIVNSYAYTASCSGFFITPSGYIVTAAHCLGKNLRIEYSKNGIKKYKNAKVILTDKENDLLILKINDNELNYFNLQNYFDIGFKVISYGYPLPNMLGKTLKQNKGVIINQENQYIETNMLVGRGASGGPLVDYQTNKVIGVVIQIIVEGEEDFSTDSVSSKIAPIVSYLETNKIHVEYNSKINNADKNVFIMID